MKRQGQLTEKIAAIENLQSAFIKAKKGKSDRAEIIKYGRQLSENLTKLQGQILSGRVEAGNYYCFTIFDPKKRLICAAPFSQRVLHHGLMNICHEYFDKTQIYDSYASRPGKGTVAALERAKYFNKKYRWFLKLDFRKYFDSIDHNVLHNQLQKRFKDRRLLVIFKTIIDSYQLDVNRGIPIGNLTSQYFANHYLAATDHYAKEILKVRAYVRYMDDIVLWHNDKAVLLDCGLRLKQYSEARLHLTLKQYCLNQNTKGLPFLGYLLFRNHLRLSHRSRVRFIKKMRVYQSNLNDGIWGQEEYQAHVLPLIAFTQYANARNFRSTVLEKMMIDGQ